MGRHFQTMSVRGIDCGLQLSTCDMHVRLERGSTDACPVVDKLSRLLRSGYRMHLDELSGLSFYVRRRNIDMRSYQLPLSDPITKVQIGVWFDTARRAHRRHACCEIQLRRGEQHLRNQSRLLPKRIFPRFEIGTRDVKQVIVHADDAGDNRVTMQVENGLARSAEHIAGRLDSYDPSVFNDHVLIGGGRLPSAVDHTHMGQDDIGSLDANILLYFRRQRWRRRTEDTAAGH